MPSLTANPSGPIEAFRAEDRRHAPSGYGNHLIASNTADNVPLTWTRRTAGSPRFHTPGVSGMDALSGSDQVTIPSGYWVLGFAVDIFPSTGEPTPTSGYVQVSLDQLYGVAHLHHSQIFPTSDQFAVAEHSELIRLATPLTFGLYVNNATDIDIHVGYAALWGHQISPNDPQ